MRGLALLAFLFISGCTTVGITDEHARDALDYGPPEVLRLCVLKDEGLSDANIKRLVDDIRTEMAPFAITIEVPWVKSWKRNGFDYVSILEGVVKSHTLTPPCDRIFAFVDRSAGDVIWGALLLPEVLGAVETYTHTRGYAVATVGSLNQIFSSPSSTAVHEFYHLLGCNHDLVMGECYKQIAQLKATTRDLRGMGMDMMPGVRWDGEWLTDRRTADSLLQGARWQ